MRRSIRLLPLLLLLASLGSPAAALPHQLYLDFNTDDDLWTINPYSTGGPVSFVIEIGDDPIPAGSGVFFAFYLGCYFDPQTMESCNCAQIDCDPGWGTPGVLQESWVDCAPLADCWDALLHARIDPGFTPVPGERYLLGTRYLLDVGGGDCEDQSYGARGDFATSYVISNLIWLHVPTPVSPEAASPTWGAMKALFRDER